MAEMLRVNTRISSDLNDWIEAYTKKTGFPKSTVIMLALDNFRQQRDAMDMMNVMQNLVNKVDGLEKKLEK